MTWRWPGDNPLSEPVYWRKYTFLGLYELWVTSGSALFDIDSIIGDSVLSADQVTAVVVYVGTWEFEPEKNTQQ